MKNQKRKEEERLLEERAEGDKRQAVRVLLRVVFLFAGTFLLYLLYSWLVTLGEGVMKATLWTYFALTLLLLSAYLICNRATLATGGKRERLPDEWSEEEKDAFLAAAARRRERTKWMLLLIVCFLSVFLLYYLDLFVLDSFRNFTGAVL